MVMSTGAMLPSVTVLLPVYNGEKFIAEAVESILRQTYTIFELLVIDDGSTDGTGLILERLALSDTRIRLHRRENRGLIATLNEGLLLSRTELVARMDADDAALPDRLEKQVAFMAQHPDVAVCGTGMVLYETGAEWRLPLTHDALRALLLFNTPVFHPTVIMRRSLVLAAGGYSHDAPCAEDYDLWERMAHAGHRFANLQEALLRYRTHPGVGRVGYHVRMAATSQDVCARQLARLGLPVDARALAVHRLCRFPRAETAEAVCRARKWLKAIVAANDRVMLLAGKDLRKEVEMRLAAFVVLDFSRQKTLYVQRFLSHCMYLRIFPLFGKRAVDVELLFHKARWRIRQLLKVAGRWLVG